MAQGTLSFTTAVLLSHTLVNCGYLCVCDGRARHYNPRLESSGEGQGHRISADFLYEPFHFTVSEGPSAPEHFLFLVNPDPDPAVGLANLLHPLKLTSPSCIVISAWVSQSPSQTFSLLVLKPSLLGEVRGAAGPLLGAVILPQVAE